MSAARRQSRAPLTARARSSEPAVYTIPASRPFARTLAIALLRDGPLRLPSADPLALARATIFVPTRRAARALTDALVAANGARATLLPRIRPFGDLDGDEAGLEPSAPEDTDALPPAIAPLARDLLLTQLVLKWDEQRVRHSVGSARDGGTARGADQAARLARALARFLDELQSERIDASKLAALAPERFAVHWQDVVEFLAIVTREWPGVLKRLGLIDHVARRNAVLEGLAARWRKAPPEHPVIAAGSTGSLPATAELIAAIARLPRGAVVLPGLDRTLDDEAWAALEPSHPQYGLKRLLEHLSVPRVAVRDLANETDVESARAARLGLIAQALRPATTTEAWRSLPPLDHAALDGLLRVECASEEEEAGVIALKLRETLETVGKTAALVTTDRALARRVVAQLERYSVEVDDSAGRPLDLTPPGTLLRLVAALAVEAVAPVPLLAVLKHPLAAGGMAPEVFRRQTRLVELACLRGPRPGPGFAGVKRALTDAGADADHAALGAWLDRIDHAFAPFAALIAARQAKLGDLLTAHIGVCEWLAASDRDRGPGRLWAGEAGTRAATFVAELAEATEGTPPLAPMSYPALFEAMMSGVMVRPTRPRHARLFIWGPLEARLQHADVMILGGLNEGSWPPEPEPDPWLSRPMREALGLSPPERRIGLAAHDFTQCCGAPEVLITRARRNGTAPTVPARWLTRLDALLQLVAPDDRHRIEAPMWRAWQAALDTPARVEPCSAPAPRPPLSARPRKLSVTAIETWLADPYSIYARHILKLDPLDGLDADPSAAERGTLIHDVLDAFLKDHPAALPADALARLIALGKARFAPLAHRPAVLGFWWPRFERIAAWFIEAARERCATGTRVLATEISGTITLSTAGGDFVLRGKADRIDRDADGTVVIIDYKTGQPPSAKQVEAGISPQLPLEAAMALQGGFGPAVPTDSPIRLEYWHLSGGEKAGEVKLAADDAGALAIKTLARLKDYVVKFDDPATPYRSVPRPALFHRFQEYSHLARIGEWLAEDES